MNPQLYAAITQLPEHAWQLEHAESDAIREWADVPYVPDDGNHRKDQPCVRRYLAVRIRRRQGELFADGNTVKHFAIVTNREGDGLTLIRWHREKAGSVEHAHHVLKNELAAEALPSGKFGANAAWFRLNVLIYNLLSALKRLALPGDLSNARPKQLRFLVFNTVGKVVQHARRTLLRLTTVTQQALVALARANILALSPTQPEISEHSLSLTTTASSAIVGVICIIRDSGGGSMNKQEARSIAVVGLGYVGLPIAVAFGKIAPVIGFDINKKKIEELRKGIDRTGEVSQNDLAATQIRYTSEPPDLKAAKFIIVAVPTPINEALQPDLTALQKSSELIGQNLSPGTIVVYESTVYPGATEEVCLPILEKTSGMKAGVDFKLGYSPERINPGDREHTLEKIIKVVSAQDSESLDIVADTYALVVKAGVHRASSIKVAEAAKVIENTQRDLNIALMNELALIFHRLGIDTKSVLEAAGTKWNFLKFSPGLVGGHCIGVDPYYLTSKAESVGYHPQVILSGRRINNGMGKFVAEHTMKLLSHMSRPANELRVGVLGLTFKENVPDLRNSKVPDIISELREYGIEVLVHDPIAESEEAVAEYGIHLVEWEKMKELDGLVVAVAHKKFSNMSIEDLLKPLRNQKQAVVIDVKGILDPSYIPASIRYWRL